MVQESSHGRLSKRQPTVAGSRDSGFSPAHEEGRRSLPGPAVHVVLDNASVHLSGDAEKWLANQDGKVIFHFTPTGASWMNQIEIWNGIITRKLIRCGTFRSVKALDREIEAFVKHWNRPPSGVI
jgi:hypothetical protein